ncbi:cytochrome P450 [Paenibacillus sp. J5C_2022]|uniref:cytochrome P450 n=1 Tax=Paenibacillus sp. J5C2022 TaxID=2977129 RepID=UPI0021CF90D7|nr:cytochrome P450 [Paenibacillus sp. J5C2022]MCU6708695.1 cytochrome P450 [Paenibacillus sp. J5C2022]
MEWLSTEELIPLQWYRRMRAESPLIHTEDDAWSCFSYDAVKTVLTDYEHFSSQFNKEPSPKEPIESSVLRIDPPRHKQMRTLVSKVFTPKAIEEMAAHIANIAGSLLDEMAGNSDCDFVRDFASPLPIMVIAEMLGIPYRDQERFKAWSDALVGNDYDQYLRCQEEMSVYFAAIAAERRVHPQQDLISKLVHARVDGEKLDEVELIGFCMLLLVAGNETTTNLLSSAMLCLDERPDLYSELAADRTLVPPTVEEVLRYCSPVQAMPRRVAKSTELFGQQLSEGQYVNVWIGSANHDERVFASPEMFDIRRKPNPHLAFGQGIHFCLGAALARLEAKVALSALLNRFRMVRRDRSVPLERLDSSIIFGVKRLPIALM